LKNRDITPRLVTEITPKNVSDCNLNMKQNDVFHSDRIKGNFLIVDGIKYLCVLWVRVILRGSNMYIKSSILNLKHL
jgi:hypothetical protein